MWVNRMQSYYIPANDEVVQEFLIGIFLLPQSVKTIAYFLERVANHVESPTAINGRFYQMVNPRRKCLLH